MDDHVGAPLLRQLDQRLDCLEGGTTVHIADADLESLDTAVEIVPAPGPGKLAVVRSAMFEAIYDPTKWTQAAVANLFYGSTYGVNLASSLDVTVTADFSHSFIVDEGSQLGFVDPAVVEEVANQPIMLICPEGQAPVFLGEDDESPAADLYVTVISYSITVH